MARLTGRGRHKEAQAETCRDCGKVMARGEPEHPSVDVGSLFLGKSVVICDACYLKRKAWDAKAEQAVLAAGYQIVHKDPDGYWAGGRWHVARDGRSIAAHSYRESAIAEGVKALQAGVPWSWPTKGRDGIIADLKRKAAPQLRRWMKAHEPAEGSWDVHDALDDVGRYLG